ncbi:DUF4064 domain-containing protein [Planococcus lenghuensis]|uniref:DUF4064 domain-containing protein n=1 Tax=Planococcus lenghuensis TaxID=2213202 RepID=A0A1Q2KYU0_9BACL|nr:DUF4064 domain-containing protein [Planococcus lenghuensis]AQQ53380.1 hypothetical protein B0X71_10030 [Planococcus lenghuensis]
MKRTGEVVIGSIGAVVYGLVAAFGGMMIWLQSNEDVLEQSLNQAAQENPEVAVGDFGAMIDTIGAGGWLLALTALAAIISGIVAMVLLKGNKNPKVAGIIFIVTAIVAAVITAGAGIIAGIFYLIAGIMCLVRKPSRMIET